MRASFGFFFLVLIILMLVVCSLHIEWKKCIAFLISGSYVFKNRNINISLQYYKTTTYIELLVVYIFI